MRRKTVRGMAVLVLMLMVWSIPVQVAHAGDYGCNSRYYPSVRYYAPTQTYSAPVNTYEPVPIPTTIYDSTFFRVAPDLAQARLAQEAASQAVNQFKAELTKQAEDQRRADAERRNLEFQQQVIQLLAARNQPVLPPVVQPSQAVDLEKARLLAENEAMRATLAKIASGTAPPATPPQNVNSANVGQAVEAPRAAKAAGSIYDVVKAHAAKSCMPCHQQNGRMNLTDPSKLTYEDVTDCINRMISDDPEFHMPKAKDSVPIEVVSDFHKLSLKAPHKK